MEEKTNQTAIAVAQQANEWQTLKKQCIAFVMSGYLPDHVTKGARNDNEALARAMTIAWKGRELGIPPLQAFTSISVINGKPCLSAELMLALCYQRIVGFKATFTTPADTQNTECTLVLQRRGGEQQAFRFTLEDAKRAGLIRPNSPWEKFPAALLRARTISAACRAVAPDAIMGCYTPEELGGHAIEVEGETVSVVTHPEALSEAKGGPGVEGPPPLAVAAIQPSTTTVRTSKDTQNGDWSRGAHGWENHPCTEPQVKRLYAIGKGMHLDAAALKELAADKFGVEHLSELTKGQIQELFYELEDLPAVNPGNAGLAAKQK